MPYFVYRYVETVGIIRLEDHEVVRTRYRGPLFPANGKYFDFGYKAKVPCIRIRDFANTLEAAIIRAKSRLRSRAAGLEARLAVIRGHLENLNVISAEEARGIRVTRNKEHAAAHYKNARECRKESRIREYQANRIKETE